MYKKILILFIVLVSFNLLQCKAQKLIEEEPDIGNLKFHFLVNTIVDDLNSKSGYLSVDEASCLFSLADSLQTVDKLGSIWINVDEFHIYEFFYTPLISPYCLSPSDSSTYVMKGISRNSQKIFGYNEGNTYKLTGFNLNDLETLCSKMSDDDAIYFKQELHKLTKKK